ncbi:hypothetical protein vseg_002284 [Gypsophila vaccaria]
MEMRKDISTITSSSTTTTTTTTTTSVEMMRWNSPIPYLFGGLALMLTLIAISLFILVCSYIHNHRRRRSSSNQDDQETGKSSAISPDNKIAFDLPRVFVVMAGDDNPTYIGTPTPTPTLTPPTDEYTLPVEPIKCGTPLVADNTNNNNNLEVV